MTYENKKNILVTGGAGYIGSHIALLLSKNNYIPVSYDNLSSGRKKNVRWGPFIKGDILEYIKILSNSQNETCISYEKSKVNIDDLIDIIKKDGIKIKDISTDDGDLEDVFLRLTKN